MGFKTVPQPPNSPDLAPCDFWLFLKLRGYRYEIIEEMKESVTKVIDTLTQEDFHEAFQKLLERYNKCIAAGEDYFEGDSGKQSGKDSIKVSMRKKSGNLFNDARTLIKDKCIDNVQSAHKLHCVMSEEQIQMQINVSFFTGTMLLWWSEHAFQASVIKLATRCSRVAPSSSWQALFNDSRFSLISVTSYAFWAETTA